jgi:hypothetical protein
VASLALAAGATALLAPPWLVLFFSGLLALAGGMGWRMARRPGPAGERRSWLLAPVAASCLAFMALAALDGLRPLYGRTVEPLARLAAVVRDEAHAPLLLYGSIEQPVVIYYSNRPAQEVLDEADLAGRLADGAAREMILPAGEMGRLAGRFEVEPLASAGGFMVAQVRLAAGATGGP